MYGTRQQEYSCAAEDGSNNIQATIFAFEKCCWFPFALSFLTTHSSGNSVSRPMPREPFSSTSCPATGWCASHSAAAALSAK